MKYLDNNGLSYLAQKIKAWLNGKVDKVDGKTLTTNDFTNNYKAAVDANTNARHTHGNQTALDEITSDKIAKWDSNAGGDNAVFVWDGNGGSGGNVIALFQQIYDAFIKDEKVIVIAGRGEDSFIFNRLKTTTFTTTSEGKTIEWNGDITGRERFEYFFKVSDEILSKEELMGQTVEIGGMAITIDAIQDIDDKNFGAASSQATSFPALVVVITETTSAAPISTGIYFMYYQDPYYVSKLSIAGVESTVTELNLWNDAVSVREYESIGSANISVSKASATATIDSNGVVKKVSNITYDTSDSCSVALMAAVENKPSYKITDEDIESWDGKQEELISGTNIKTINNQSILGSGNIDIDYSGQAFWEDISDVDTEIVTYASDITFSYKKMYRIANKFIYFVCAGVKASAATAITIGNIKEFYRPPLTTYIGGCGPESKPITVSASIDGDIIARLPSNGTWFGFSITWAIKDPNE